eukprot:Gb_21604 [translate_table: standard]
MVNWKDLVIIPIINLIVGMSTLLFRAPIIAVTMFKDVTLRIELRWHCNKCRR